MREFLRGLHLILTLDCEKAARVMSDSCERGLSIYEQSALRFHNLICRACRCVQQQLVLVRQAFRQLALPAEHGGRIEPVGLSEAARGSLKQALREHLASGETNGDGERDAPEGG